MVTYWNMVLPTWVDIALKFYTESTFFQKDIRAITMVYVCLKPSKYDCYGSELLVCI